MIKLSKIFGFLREEEGEIPKGIPKKDGTKLKNIALQKLDDNIPLTDEDKNAIINYFTVLSNNSKTEVAMGFLPGDKKFHAEGTCLGMCPFCYVFKAILGGKSGWVNKLIRLTKLIRLYPDVYETALKKNVHEYISAHEIDAIRWFDSGDYKPFMKDVIIALANEFPEKKWYIISKQLAEPENQKDIWDLLSAEKVPAQNIFLNLSYWKETINNLSQFEGMKDKYPNLRICYTLDQWEGIKMWKGKWDEKTGGMVKGEELDVDELEYESKKRSAENKAKAEKKMIDFRNKVQTTWSEIVKFAAGRFDVEGIFVNAGQSYPDNIRIDLISDKARAQKPEIVDAISTVLMSKQSDYFFNKRKSSTKPDSLYFTNKKEAEKKKKEKELKPFEVDIDNPDVLKKLKVIVEISPEYMEKLKVCDVIFNVNRGTAFRVGYRKSKLAFCKCDLKIIEKTYACTKHCGVCYSVNLKHQPMTESANGMLTFIMEEVDIEKYGCCD